MPPGTLRSPERCIGRGELESLLWHGDCGLTLTGHRARKYATPFRALMANRADEHSIATMAEPVRQSHPLLKGNRGL
jgi:hypothetical protein